jgi:hypothetical protein
MTDLKRAVVAHHVIGVIKDFNFKSLHDQVSPLVLHLQQDDGGMAVRISTHDTYCMVYHEQMAAGICLSNQYWLVDVCGCRRYTFANSACYHKFPGYQSGSRQSGQELKNGLRPLRDSPTSSPENPPPTPGVLHRKRYATPALPANRDTFSSSP